MSDYRFQVVEHNGIPCLHVIFDDEVIDADGFEKIIQTYIPIDDIQAAIGHNQAQELAQKILDLIERTEQKTAQEPPLVGDDAEDEQIQRGFIRYMMLKAEIKALCKEQLAQKEDNHAR